MLRVFKWVMLAFFLLPLIVVSLVAIAALVGPVVPPDSILHVTLDGEIRESPEPSLKAFLDEDTLTDLHALAASIRRAARDDRIVGLVLEVKEPEMGIAQVLEIEGAMAAFRDSKKWSTAFLETAGEFSRGNRVYALAACADQIVLSPPGDINVVGLEATTPFLKTALEKLHVQTHVQQRHEFKDAANMFTQVAMTPQQRQALKAVVDDLQEEVVMHLARRRGVEAEVARAWLTQGPHPGTTAQALGLVDAIGYWDKVEAEAEKISGRADPWIRVARYHASGDWHARGPEVALVIGEGVIVRGQSSAGMQVMGSDTLAQGFRAARAAKVRGVLFRVNSGGGSYVASDVLRREVELTRQAGIPVVVSMGDVAASGGYFVAMAADRIVAQPSTITGSIGVLLAVPYFRDFFSHFLGVTFDSYAGAANAQFFSFLDPPSPSSQQRIGGFLDRIYDDFVAKVATHRHLAPEVVEGTARGRIWSGRAALKLGLVDELGDMEVALASLKKILKLPAEDDVNLRLYPEPENPLTRMVEMLADTAGVYAALAAGQRLANDLLRSNPQAQLRMSQPWVVE